jgi:hypothetical protein
MTTNISVYGIFKSRLHMNEGLHNIRASGFRAEDISVLMPETDGSKDMGIENSTKSPEGVAVGGAAGAVAGGLVGIGIPEYEAQRYEGRIKSGGILVSIHCDDKEWAEKAKEVFVVTGAEGISASTEGKADYMVTDKPVVMSRL